MACKQCKALNDEWYDIGYSHGYRGEFKHTLPGAPTKSAQEAAEKGWEEGYEAWERMRQEANRGRRNFGVHYRTER